MLRLILRRIHLPKKLLLSLSKDCGIKQKNAVDNKLCFSSWGKKKMRQWPGATVREPVEITILKTGKKMKALDQ